MNHEELVTPRLVLKKLTQESYDYIFSELNDQEIMQFLGISSEVDLSIEKIKFAGGLSTHNKKFLYFQLIDKSTMKIIGWCGFHTWYIDHFRAEIGYGLMLDENKGKGYMTEAIKPIVEYGFSKMKLHRIEAFVAPYNEPSLRLLQKLNFTKEGHLREHYFANNKAEDSIVYSLLKSEFIC